MADDEDLIVVDDLDDNDAFQPSHRATPKNQPQRSLPPRASRPTRRMSTPPYVDPSEGRTTRSSARGPKIQPKLKLKLSEKAAAQAPGMSFLGPYDRELDSDEEELVFEEQFILRMPAGDDCDRLRKMVQAREISDDVWFKFKDSRRAVFHIGNNTYSSKLVDLPCIIESQKTLDNKQMFKVADICQMLVVEDKIAGEESLSNQKSFNIDEFIWPHGITPPLKHVRQRRFRKRVNRRTIETVEQEVERLLEEDALASEVKYDVLENVNPDLSDSELIEHENVLDPTTPGFAGSDGEGAPTPGGTLPEGDDDGGDDSRGGMARDEEDEAEGDIDEELAAELDLALGDDEEDEEDEEDEDEESDEDDDEDEDDDDAVQARRLLNEEIHDLEAAVAKKRTEIASSANPLIKRRFDDALKKLQADLDMKMAQRDEMKEQQRLRKEGIVPGGPGGGGQDADDDDAEEDEDEGDLFGEDPGNAMEIG
ncbi:Transcription initiation factor TFIID subunit 7 [Trametes pubescens]|uniref:Transcription initiation factor TFIID subunit 7 n=1 Tax=Trametes pubescens TaxID=154538 RepID=A0A1M2VEZ7_TRAPU|nr:Transcription initiation factor TFIID subunit 7 [Trametes pubescens]